MQFPDVPELLDFTIVVHVLIQELLLQFCDVPELSVLIKYYATNIHFLPKYAIHCGKVFE